MIAELIMAASAGVFSTTAGFYGFSKVKNALTNSGKKNAAEIESDSPVFLPLSHFTEQIDKSLKDAVGLVSGNLSRIKAEIEMNSFKHFKTYVDVLQRDREYFNNTTKKNGAKIPEISVTHSGFHSNIRFVKFNEFTYVIYVLKNKMIDMYEISDSVAELNEINDKINEAEWLKKEYNCLNREESETREIIDTKIENGKIRAKPLYRFIGEFVKDSDNSEKIEKSVEVYNKAMMIDL